MRSTFIDTHTLHIKRESKCRVMIIPDGAVEEQCLSSIPSHSEAYTGPEWRRWSGDCEILGVCEEREIGRDTRKGVREE